MRLFKVLAVCLVIVFEECLADDTDDGILMLPNERTTLDDCHLRFHKLNPQIGLIGPVFAHPAKSKEFAHVGAIGWTQPDGLILWKCTGTLIWYDFVLTAAHCLVDGGNQNQPPDVVRLGDSNLYMSNDDQYAQQFKIVGIYRHPDHDSTTYYHDVTLLKLEKNITLHDTVCPACLLNDEEVRFRPMEAIEWGKSKFAKEQIPALLKTPLKPISNQECGKVYSNETNQKFTKGIADEHICAVDEGLDICNGNPGGPLQVRLLHNGRMSPFIVGVTVFGGPCGTKAPRVSIRVAPYYDWIIETMKTAGANVDANSMNSTLCALRFAKYREYEDKIIWTRSEDYVSVNTGWRHMTVAEKLPSFVVQLGWALGGYGICFGVLVDEDTVLTTAKCATYKGAPADFINYLEFIQTDVKTVHIHPEYVEGNAYNNIAIIRLKSPIDISLIEPTCIWLGRNVPDIMDVYGFGRHDINEFFWTGEDSRIDSSQTYLQPKASFKNSTNCAIPEQFKSRFPDGLTSEHICTGNDVFLVPESCKPLHGGPLVGKEFRKTATYSMTYGLTQFGEDCGFGEDSVATGFANHLDWMKSVLLEKHQTSSDVIQSVKNDTKEEYSTLSNCPKLVQDQNVTNPDGSMAFIGWSTPSSGVDLRCLGSIITSRIVLTTASCLGPDMPDIVKPASNSTDLQYEVNTTVIHFGYNSVDHSNDIALVRVRGEFIWSSQLYPSCLWLNVTHSPLVVKTITTSKDGIYFRFGLTMYNTDCQRFHRNKLHGSQICARVPDSSFVCNSITDQLRYDKIHNGKLAVSYLVGLGTRLEGCGELHYMLYTRITSFIDWIGENV